MDEVQHVKSLLRDEEINIVGEVSDASEILESISSTSADMVVITNIDPVYLRACEQIYLLRPRTIPVALVDKADLEQIEQITKTGVHNIIDKNLDQTELIKEVRGIYSSESNRIRSIESASGSSSKSKVITVFGTKGGVGRTTVAVNLALELAQRRRKVCLVDANLQFGNAGNMMGISNPNTIAELLEEDSNPNIDTIRQFLSLDPSGVNLLLAPNDPEDGANITASQMDRVIASLRVYYDYVIIDVQPAIDDMLTVFLDSSSTILFVTTSDIVSLRNSKKGLSLLTALGSFEKTQLVLNGPSSQINSRDIERVLGLPIWVTFPDEPKIALAASNQGRPFVQSNPDSGLSKSVRDLASKIDGNESKKRDAEKSFALKDFLSFRKK